MGVYEPVTGPRYVPRATHAARMRDIVRSELGAPGRLAEAFDAMTEAELTPWYRATLDVDRNRQAEIDAIIDGSPYHPRR